MQVEWWFYYKLAATHRYIVVYSCNVAICCYILYYIYIIYRVYALYKYMLFYCFLKNKLLELKEINKFSFKLKKRENKRSYPMQQCSFRCPDDIWKRFKLYCTMKNVKLQDMLMRLIVDHMEKEQWITTKEKISAESSPKDIRRVSAAS